MHLSQKILALDYGTARVGVALSYGSLAEPLTILTNDATLFSQINKLVAEHAVTMLLIGISESKTMERTIQFVGQLRQQVSIPIELTDETLSTQNARQKLQQTGKTVYESQTARVDHLAAANFVQEWLDTHAQDL
jgi:putative transcription antitermination factor YqgF